MKEQVLSIEQMQELIKLGINTSKASMCWNTYDSFLIENNSDLKDAFNYSDDDWVPTFSIQDILEILPQSFYVEKNTTSLSKKAFLQINKTLGRGYSIAYEQSWDEDGKLKIKMHGQQLNKSLLEAAFNMLKWCKENNYI